MTPTRAKRNSRAPERFSSDDIKTDTTNATSNSGHGDKLNSSTKIKLKAIIREPLKVKLPKLRRPRTMQSLLQAKDSTGMNRESSFAKIKLPPKRNIDRQGNRYESSKLTSSSSHQMSAAKHNQFDDKIGPTKHESSDLNSTSPLINNDLNKGDSVLESGYSMEDQISRSDEGNSTQETDAAKNQTEQKASEKKPEIPNSSGIRCPCGVDDDLGVMVECEKCSNWQHGHCINVGQEEDAYEGYVCAYCLLPLGKQNDSLQQLVIDDKLQIKFEALEASMKLRSGAQNGNGEEASDDHINFTNEELEMATSDLRRVSNSLEAKWKLLTNDDYNAELKIWKNPIWSDDPEENLKQQQQTVRFVGDIYKSNLRLNICNMLNRMHKRCQLIRYQISRIHTGEQDSQSKFDKLLVTLDVIASLVEKVTDNLKTI